MPSRSQAEKELSAPSQGPPAPLLKALQDTGRTRGSSAMPHPLPSPVPPGGKSFYEHMNRLTLTDRSGPMDTQSGKRKELMFSESSDSSGADGSSQSLTPKKPITVRDVAEEAQDRLNKLISFIQQAKLPNNVQKDLVAEVKSIGEDFRDHQKRLADQVDRLGREREAFKDRLVETTKHLQSSTIDRDHFRKEATSIKRSLEDLRQEYNQRGIDMITNKQELRDEIERLTQKVNMQEEQLRGKRALWLESNPGSSARRSAMNTLRDPFKSPTVASFNPGVGGNTSSMQTPSMASPALSGNNFPPSSSPRNTIFEPSSSRGPPPKMTMPSIPELRQAPRRRLGLPYQKPTPGSGITFSNSVGISREYATNPTEALSNPDYGAMVLYNKDPEYDPAPEFMEDFARLFVAIEGWVKDHANLGNPANDDNLMKNQGLWDYMMNCTYPGRRNDAHAHTLALIKDRGCRYWFVMRMITSYVFNSMLSLNAWRGFNEETDRALGEVAAQLANQRGMANENRQKVVEKRVSAMKSVTKDSKYSEWRVNKLREHTKELRNMLGPMLNAGSDRAAAGKDLGVLAIRAWDQSAKNNSAPYTFQIYFPDTNAKFTAGSMVARDRPDLDPTQLQIKQARIKLVVTPVITLRDDNGTTIKARSLHVATVLLMG